MIEYLKLLRYIKSLKIKKYSSNNHINLFLRNESENEMRKIYTVIFKIILLCQFVNFLND